LTGEGLNSRQENFDCGKNYSIALNLRVAEIPFGLRLKTKARYSFLDIVKQIIYNADSKN